MSQAPGLDRRWWVLFSWASRCGSVILSACRRSIRPSKWSDLLQPKSRMFQLRKTKQMFVSVNVTSLTRWLPYEVRSCSIRCHKKIIIRKKEKRQWHTGYSPRPPTSPYRSQSLHAGWPPVCSSIFQVLLKSVQWFWRCGWSKIAIPHYFGYRLIP